MGVGGGVVVVVELDLVMKVVFEEEDGASLSRLPARTVLGFNLVSQPFNVCSRKGRMIAERTLQRGALLQIGASFSAVCFVFATVDFGDHAEELTPDEEEMEVTSGQ